MFLFAIAPPSTYSCQLVSESFIVSDLEIAIASPSFASLLNSELFTYSSQLFIFSPNQLFPPDQQRESSSRSTIFWIKWRATLSRLIDRPSCWHLSLNNLTFPPHHRNQFYIYTQWSIRLQDLGVEYRSCLFIWYDICLQLSPHMIWYDI